MGTQRTVRCFAALVCLEALAAAGAGAQNADTIIIPLTDPGRPAIVSVNAFTGDIVIRGVNRSDILVRNPQARGGGRPRRDTPPGMRRLTPDSGLRIEERNNEVTIEPPCGGLMRRPQSPAPNPKPNPGPNGNLQPSGSASFPWMPALPKLTQMLNGLPCVAFDDDMDVEIEVPLKSSLRISTLSGDVTVSSVDGAIETNSIDGDVMLTNVGGSVVAHSVDGDITAVITRADAGAPMAFTTLDGDVDVTLPSSIKANLRLRSETDDIFTDFDIPPGPVRQPPRGSRQPDGRTRIEVERAVIAPLNGGGPEIELRTFDGDIYLRKGK